DRADVRAVGIELDAWARAGFTLVVGADRAEVQLSVHGSHQVSNALAVATVCTALGFAVRDIAAALTHCPQLSAGRMQVAHRPDGVTIINDAYNANPESMRAALKALAVASRPPDRRSWAILGEMLELGEAAVAEHDAIGRLAVRLNIAQLVVVGAGARAIHTGAVQEGSWGGESVFLPDIAEAVDLVRAELRPGDVVLVKSSRAAGLEELALELMAEAAGDPR
ncbi:MAG: glutamate ligase domain-containing protein, partial [Angustibacter sp.]